MAKNLNNFSFPDLKRVAQLNNFYCGPAVLEMLLSFLGVSVSQEEAVRSAGVSQKIKKHGVTIEELSLAAGRLTADYQFWFKKYSTLAELSKIVNVFKYPVGVEWQGIFEDSQEDGLDIDDDDPGHYSVVTAISTHDNLIEIADPYPRYAGKDRQLSVLQFERRWWDINEVIDPRTKKHKEIDDYHAMFVITLQEVTFPKQLGMSR